MSKPNDTDRTDRLPDTEPPAPLGAGERALMDSFLLLDLKLDKVLEMLGNIVLLVEDVRAAQTVHEDRIGALEAIPPRPTMLPPANGHG